MSLTLPNYSNKELNSTSITFLGQTCSHHYIFSPTVQSVLTPLLLSHVLQHDIKADINFLSNKVNFSSWDSFIGLSSVTKTIN